MSSWHRVLGAHGRRIFDSGDNDDLEQGRQPATMPDEFPSRTSYSDSEFSEYQYPVSLDRYERALQAIEGSSSPNPIGMEDPIARVAHDVQNENQQKMALNPGSSQTSSSSSAMRTDHIVHSARGRSRVSSSSRLRSPTPPLLYGRQMLTASTNSMQEEQDWETEAKTGSSLANNSDLGDPSIVPAVTSAPEPRTVQYGGMPRHNQAYMVIHNAITGDSSRIPQNNVSTGPIPRFQASITYEHPTPLSTSHPNPFITAHPILRPHISTQEEEPSKLSVPRTTDSPERISKQSIHTDSFNEMVKIYGSSSELDESCQILGKDLLALKPNEQSKMLNNTTTESSAWGTTTSEGDSKNTDTALPVATRKGSFARAAVVNKKANLTGTPEGTGAREVGSSLAGTSSPPTLTGSLSDTPNFRYRHLKLLTTPEASPTTPPQLRSGASNSLSEIRRRRRSSSESRCLVISSPLKTKSSALPSPGFRGHRKRNTMTEFAPSGSSSFYEDEDYQYESSLRERRTHQTLTGPDVISSVPIATGQQTYNEDVQISKKSTSEESRAFVDGQGVVHTDVPRPTYVHPVYGVRCPWDTPMESRGRPQNRPDGFVRPIARAESPHLHRVPRRPTAAMLKRQENLSSLWLVLFCLMPPVTPLFGHGALDGIIRFQTQGEIEAFTDSSKAFALWWGYSAMSFIFLTLIIAAALGMFS